MRTNHFAVVAAAASAALAFAGPAAAQLPGAGVEIGGKADTTVKQDRDVTVVGLGQRASAHSWNCSALGKVKIGGNWTCNVHQKGRVTVVALGQDAHASSVNGTASSYRPY